MGIIAFISYSSKDSQLYKIPEIAKELNKYPEIEKVLYSGDYVEDDFYEYMEDNLRKAHILLIFCSPNALQSRYVKKEWSAFDELDKPIVPIFLEKQHIPTLLSTRLGWVYDQFNFQNNIENIYKLILRKVKIPISEEAIEEQLDEEFLKNLQKVSVISDSIALQNLASFFKQKEEIVEGLIKKWKNVIGLQYENQAIKIKSIQELQINIEEYILKLQNKEEINFLEHKKQISDQNDESTNQQTELPVKLESEMDTEISKEDIEWREEFDIARNLFFDQHYREARQKLEKLLQKKPDHPEAERIYNICNEKAPKSQDEYEMARSYFFEKKYRLAIPIFEKYLEIDHNNHEAKRFLEYSREHYPIWEEMLEKAIDLVDKNHISEAIMLFQEILTIKPDHNEAKSFLQTLKSDDNFQKIEDYYNQGRNHYLNGEYEKALHLFEEVLYIDANHLRAKKFLKMCQSKIK